MLFIITSRKEVTINEHMDNSRCRPDFIWTEPEQKQLKAIRAVVLYHGSELFGIFHRLYNGGDKNEKHETKQEK